mmetsp:Transcript_53174/g.65186  ORF Transcript_53174/g.65186 Transcript_53174/m.65186 type:complete len:215 (+) Transcript_53174:45-689(+)
MLASPLQLTPLLLVGHVDESGLHVGTDDFLVFHVQLSLSIYLFAFLSFVMLICCPNLSNGVACFEFFGLHILHEDLPTSCSLVLVALPLSQLLLFSLLSFSAFTRLLLVSFLVGFRHRVRELCAFGGSRSHPLTLLPNSSVKFLTVCWQGIFPPLLSALILFLAFFPHSFFGLNDDICVLILVVRIFGVIVGFDDDLESFRCSVQLALVRVNQD